MKIRIGREQGNVLLVTLFITAVVGFALISYLLFTGNYNQATHRSQMWNQSLVIAEAGVEEAMAHLNANRGSGLLCCGWSGGGAGGYSLQRSVADGHFLVTISTNDQPVITSRGFARIPLVTNELARTVQIALLNPPGGGGMELKDYLDLNGNNIVVDSYDSSNTNYSTLGRYDVAKRKDGVRVTIEGGMGDKLSIGNGDIWGTAGIGPGTTLKVGPKGSLGDLAWHAAGGKGIQPGSLTDDAIVSISDPPAPPGGAVTPTKTSKTFKVNGIHYDYQLASKVYQLTNLSQSTYVSGKATLIVSGTVQLGSGVLLAIAPLGSLTMYCYGPVKVTGTALTNSTGLPKNLMIYGMKTCSSITFSAATDFIGQIHAPNAIIQAGGGGGSVQTFSGSLAAKALTMVGHFSYHYDESLKMGSTNTILKVVSWKEL